MAPKRNATDVYSLERKVRAGTSRGNTWATFEDVERRPEPAEAAGQTVDQHAAARRRNDVAIARTEAMDSIRRRTIAMLRNSEGNKPPEHKPRTIKWLIERFCAGELCIHGNSQRGMVCNVAWARQFVSMLINSSTSVPAITLRKVIEPRAAKNRTVNREVFYVTDGAQRLTAILWFYLGLLEVDIIDKPLQRRSQRRISRVRREAGVEADPKADTKEEYTMQFFDRAASLMASNQPRFPLVYSPCDERGVPIAEDEEVDDDHPGWCLDMSGANTVYHEDAPDHVRDFFDKYVIAVDIGSAYYQRQTAESQFASDEVRLRFLSREIGVDETAWSQQAGSHVNLWQSLQQYFFGVNELVSLVGDHASEWLKSLVGDLIDITGKWGVGHEMQMAYGALVRAFVIAHGAPRVPVQDDAPLWAFVIDYLGDKFLVSPPSDLMKRRFAAAVRNITACNVPTRKDTRLNTDEVTLMIALTYHAISDEHLPDDLDDKQYRASVIGTEDRARLAGLFAVMKAKGVKQKVTKLHSKFNMARGAPQKLAEHLNSCQAIEGRRNLARYVRHVLRYIPFDAVQYEDQEEPEPQPEPAADCPPPASDKEDASDHTAVEKEDEGGSSSSSDSDSSRRNSDADSSGDEAEEENGPVVNESAAPAPAPGPA